MSLARDDHAAVLLTDGRVLVVDRAGTAEIFDPGLETWTTMPGMQVARWGSAITLLRDGRVLVSGGRITGESVQPDHAFPRSELFDPATGTWSPIAAMPTLRSSHSATLLADGRVIVAGGSGIVTSASDETEVLASAELFDPATGAWLSTGSMQAARSGHAAVLEADGYVLVVGGPTAGAFAERFDPLTGTWHEAGASAGLLGPVALPGDDRVIVFVDALGNVASYDRLDPVLRLLGNTAHGFGASATRLTDGRILVVGGSPYGRVDPLADVHLFEL